MLTLTNAKAKEQAVDIFVEAKMLEKRICSTPKNLQSFSSGFSFSEVCTEFSLLAFDLATNLAQCSSNYTCYQCGAKHRRE